MISKWLLFSFLTSSVMASSNYHVLSKIPIGGEGRWDCAIVDADARRLYIANSTRVVVVDVDAKTIAGVIEDTPGVHDVALAPELNRGFISNGKANTVTIFDPKTLAKIGSVKTGENPDIIVYEPTTARIFAFNGRSHDATVINAKTGDVVATIPLEGKPEFAVIDGAGKIYVNIEDKNAIAEIDANQLTVLRTFSIAPGQEPSGLAIDKKSRRLFSVCHNKIMVIVDAATGKILGTPPIGQNPDGVVFDPDTATVFSSNGDGTLTLVREIHHRYETVATVPTARGARTLALDSKTHRLFLPTADYPAVVSGAPPQKGRPIALPDTFYVVVVGN
jgi:YVTN family beta-propeller protein